ncbi:hypothetical protein Golomagni_04911 [Golovinomyces magnicellulatus]|nr:hypothetical protein Golomagni_04911 [Golovinomyces magnicellulatus]
MSSSAPRSQYVTLVSSDGFEFVVLREAACISGMIKTMLAGEHNQSEISTPRLIFMTITSREAIQGRCVFKEIK